MDIDRLLITVFLGVLTTAFLGVLTVAGCEGYRYHLIATSEDPVATACALEVSSRSTSQCQVLLARVKEVEK